MSQRTERAVQERYAAAAKVPEAALCCPVDYDRRYLEILPPEVIEKDYGCGDPSRYLKPGETVLDLGSGAGKICFIAAQVVGPTGRVIGVDMTDEMLEVARRNAPIVAERLGYGNVEFRKGRIQDLALDIELLDRELKRRPITDAASFLAAEDLAQELRVRQPLVPSDSIDAVVSNCVLNLVEADAKRKLFAEIFRVLKNGGRAVISDIVADKPVPAELQNDSTLWSGCISGALTEEGFLQAFADAGFHGLQIIKRDGKPWQMVRGIEFRSVTVQALKDNQESSADRSHEVIYLGPFKEVLDDCENRYTRGARCVVSEKAARRLQGEPYPGHFAFAETAPQGEVSEKKLLDVPLPRLSTVRETKGSNVRLPAGSEPCCGGEGSGSCC